MPGKVESPQWSSPGTWFGLGSGLTSPKPSLSLTLTLTLTLTLSSPGTGVPAYGIVSPPPPGEG